jgi:hypothetical protein
VEPELAVAHHTTSDPERREVEPSVARLVDHDLTGLESPVGEVAGVADETPDRVVRVIFRQVGPKGCAVGGVQVGIEEVGRGAERNVVYGASASEQETGRMRLTGVEVQNLPKRALHNGEPLDLPVLVMFSHRLRPFCHTTSTHLPCPRLLLDSDGLAQSRT